jgi:thiamine biosynthesis lipoprotein
MVNAGGDTAFLGDRRGKPWIVGIQNPRDRENIVARIPLADEAISTSGDYERYFDEEGKRHHHILVPRTGKSPHVVHSVTLVGPHATRTDGLTKTVFILGAQRGLEFIERLGDVEAVVVDTEGRIHASKGFSAPV